MGNLIDKRHHHTTATTMPLIQFRAGRCERRQNTKWVDPQPGKGLISLEQSNEDGLMHFQYKDLESNTLIDDLILFPGDATFSPVPASTSGRVYVLKFSSSSARHFYWMQDVSNEQDSRRAARVNALIDDPDAPESQDDSQAPSDGGSGGDVAMSSSEAEPESSSSLEASGDGGSSSNNNLASMIPNLPDNVTPEQMAQLQALFSGSSTQASRGGGVHDALTPSASLADILSPARLLNLLETSPSVAQSLYQYLPQESATVPYTLESLKRVVTSPELRKSARGMDQALTSGALGPLAGSLGLREDETFGVEAYLRGVQRLGDAEKQKDGDMSTD